MKKFITIAAAAAFLFAGNISANAQSLEDQIASLMAQIAALQGSSSVVASTSGYTHTFTLTQGMSANTQVAALQACLGIADDGVFGSGTAAAVRSFQSSHSLYPDAVVGPMTGSKVEMACSTTVVVEDDMDDEEESTTEFSSSNGEEADVEEVKIDKGDDDEPANNSEEQEAFEITVELDEDGGDAQIERLDLTFAATSTPGGEEDLYDIIEKVTIMVDGDEVASMDTDDDDDWRDNLVDEDTIRISGIDTVVEAGEEVVFVVALDIADLDEDDDLDIDLELVEVEIRYTDEAGITDTVTEDDGETVTIEAKEEFELNFDESNDNPEDDETLNLSEDIDGQVLFIADVEVEEDGQDGTLEEVTLDVTVTLKTAATEDLDTDELIDELAFMIDGDEIDTDDASVEILDGDTVGVITFTFDLDDMEVEVEDEFEVSVEADLKELDDDSEFIGATIEMTEIVFDGEDSEGDDVDTDLTDDNLSFAPTYTASAGALVLEESDVDGYNEIGDEAEAAKAVFEFELTADGDEDVTLDTIVLDLNGTEEDVDAADWADELAVAPYTIRVEIKDGSDWEYVLEAGALVDESVDNVIEDGDTEMFRVTVIIDATDALGGTDQYELELKEIDYTDALSVSGTLDMNVEADNIDLLG